MDTEKENSQQLPTGPVHPILADSEVNEDRALSLLKSPDLTATEIEQLAVQQAVLKSRKVRFALAAHPLTPRRIALRLIREFYTFDLVQFSLRPATAGDLKRRAEDLLISRLASVTLGERIALARRCSANVGSALLLDREPRVWQTVLANARLTEPAILRALQRPTVTPALVEGICRDAKWSLRHEIRIALLRNAHTPLARAIEFARNLAPPQLRDILHHSKLPESIKECLRKHSDDKRPRTNRESPPSAHL